MSRVGVRTEPVPVTAEAARTVTPWAMYWNTEQGHVLINHGIEWTRWGMCDYTGTYGDLYMKYCRLQRAVCQCVL